MSSLHRWVKAYSSVDINNDNTSNIFRGSGNYSSDELKELARLKKENRDLKDALEILKKAMNILKRDFNPKGPDAAWCTDITYIWTYTEGFVYLTSIMDLYSRKIIAWVLTKDMTAQSVLEVIKTAKQRRNIQQPLVIHSDRGIQFTSEEYRELTEKMKRSYSKKGTPWDNACIESFHALIKREWLNRYKIWDYQQAKRLIFEYIETFYNTIRIHKRCDYLSPDTYEKEYYANQIKQLNLN